MWLYKDKELNEQDIPSTAIGFLYKITKLSTGQWYLGRKMLTAAATKTVNGKKKKIRKESDWKDYWSSSKNIQADIAENGPDDYVRTVLLFVDTKAALTYSEEFILYKSGSLFDPLCMNENIRAKIYRTWFKKTPTLHQDLESLVL